MVNKPGNRSHIQKYPEHSSSVFGRIGLDDALLQKLQDANSRAIQLFSEIPFYNFGIPTDIVVENYDAKIRELVRVDPTEGEIDINLPTINTKMLGGAITIMNISSSVNSITINAAEDDSIGAGTSITISATYGVACVVAVNKKQWIKVF
jgi:hypothetical protein